MLSRISPAEAIFGAVLKTFLIFPRFAAARYENAAPVVVAQPHRHHVLPATMPAMGITCTAQIHRTGGLPSTVSVSPAPTVMGVM